MPLTMPPALRKFALTAHLATSVGLLGAIAAFLALAVAGLASADAPMIRAAYPAMDLTARWVIVPLAFAALLTGVVQSLGTPWGLLRHYWVLAKLLLTAFATAVLLAKLALISHAAGLAAEPVLRYAELRAAGLQLVVHSAGGLLVLLVPAILSVYKPRGLTPYGRRSQRAPAPRPSAQSPRPAPQSARPGRDAGAGAWPGGGLITITARQAYAFGAIVIVLHVLALHLAGVMPGGH